MTTCCEPAMHEAPLASQGQHCLARSATVHPAEVLNVNCKEGFTATPSAR